MVGTTCLPCTASSCPPGQYRGACTASADAPCVPCSTGPANSEYTGAGSPFDQNNCQWACSAGFRRSGDTCLACDSTACPTGEYRGVCTATGDGPCLPCTAKPANAVFTAGGIPYDRDNCPWACGAGFFRSGDVCMPCSRDSCPVGQYRGVCTATADAACVPCTVKPSDSNFVTGGQPFDQDKCQWGCTAGFYRSASDTCVACDTTPCPVGQYRGACTATASGQCVACTTKPANAEFTAGGSPYDQDSCAWACASGFYQSGGSCLRCSIDSCPVGQFRGACAANSDAPCVPCTQRPSDSQFSTAGQPFDQDNCRWTCASGFEQIGTSCVPLAIVAPPPAPLDAPIAPVVRPPSPNPSNVVIVPPVVPVAPPAPAPVPAPVRPGPVCSPAASAKGFCSGPVGGGK
jgi:hypothetical protein